MNLHQDKDAFEELVTATSLKLHIPPNIVEKDYYVTLALQELSAQIKGMVFKSGTSLTKCYQLLDRFSEDIDISYAASEGISGESRKRHSRHLYDIHKIMENIILEYLVILLQILNIFLQT